LTDFVGFHTACMGGLLESVEDVFSHFFTAYRFSALRDNMQVGRVKLVGLTQ